MPSTSKRTRAPRRPERALARPQSRPARRRRGGPRGALCAPRARAAIGRSDEGATRRVSSLKRRWPMRRAAPPSGAFFLRPAPSAQLGLHFGTDASGRTACRFSGSNGWSQQNRRPILSFRRAFEAESKTDNYFRSTVEARSKTDNFFRTGGRRPITFFDGPIQIIEKSIFKRENRFKNGKSDFFIESRRRPS